VNRDLSKLACSSTSSGPSSPFSTLIVLFKGCGCIFIFPYLSAYLYIPLRDAMHLDTCTRIGSPGVLLNMGDPCSRHPAALAC